MRWIFILVLNDLVCKMTDLFVHTWKNSYGHFNGVLYLYAALFLSMTWHPTLQPWSIIVEFLRIKYFSICACLRWCIYIQYATWLIGRIIYHKKNIWTRLLPLVMWYVDRTTKAASSSIPIRGSEWSTYV